MCLLKIRSLLVFLFLVPHSAMAESSVISPLLVASNDLDPAPGSGVSWTTYWLTIVFLLLTAVLVLLIRPMLLRPKMRAKLDRVSVLEERERHALENMEEARKEQRNMKEEFHINRQEYQTITKKLEADYTARIKELETAGVEQQNRLNAFPMDRHLRAFARLAENVTQEDFKDKKLVDEFIHTYEVFTDLFDRTNEIPLGGMASVSNDIKRINQIEIVIQQYSAKIMNVKNSDDLDEELRETQLAYWQRLMDTEIAKLEEI